MTYGHKEFVTAGEAGAYRYREIIGSAVSGESVGKPEVAISCSASDAVVSRSGAQRNLDQRCSGLKMPGRKRTTERR